MHRRSRRAFTLVELLTVIAIIMVVAGLLLGTLGAARTAAKKARAHSEVDQIRTAWLAYQQEYRRFPAVGITEMAGDAMQILRGATNTPLGRQENPLAIAFMDFRDGTTQFRDPWKNVYGVALDQSDPPDNRVTVPGDGNIYASAAAWSGGPDGRVNTRDDIVSWKR